MFFRKDPQVELLKANISNLYNILDRQDTEIRDLRVALKRDGLLQPPPMPGFVEADRLWNLMVRHRNGYAEPMVARIKALEEAVGLLYKHFKLTRVARPEEVKLASQRKNK